MSIVHHHKAKEPCEPGKCYKLGGGKTVQLTKEECEQLTTERLVECYPAFRFSLEVLRRSRRKAG